MVKIRFLKPWFSTLVRASTLFSDHCAAIITAVEVSFIRLGDCGMIQKRGTIGQKGIVRLWSCNKAVTNVQ